MRATPIQRINRKTLSPEDESEIVLSHAETKKEVVYVRNRVLPCEPAVKFRDEAIGLEFWVKPEETFEHPPRSGRRFRVASVTEDQVWIEELRTTHRFKVSLAAPLR